ncbi:DUF2812 domain-containing protein [uncultured Dysosmobacter sp.]|uniref:DUF2812 domain-containing protein n=1 Tax=uncultured Dysosmobacter sp. TaxID=2591384 RepID=UPI002621A20A|nr:DUF2812 domain-containing protein [uncultured Dysosmobacter sp.]
MKNTKREYLITYTLYERGRIEAHLEKRASEGWLLESVGPGGWRYRRIEPQKLRFSVAYLPQASQFTPANSQDAETFRDYCAAAGWTFAADSGQAQIFYTADENAVPIETDPAVELDTIRRSAGRSLRPLVMLVLVEALLLGGTNLQRLRDDAVDVLSNPVYLMNLTSLLPLLLITVGYAVIYGLWLRRARRAVEAGGSLPSFRSSRTLNIVTWGLVGIQVLAMLLFSGSRQMRGLFLIMIAAISLMGGLTAVATNAMRRLNFKSWVNRLVSLGMILALTIGLMAGLLAWIFHSSGSLSGKVAAETYQYHGMTWEVYHDQIPLRLEDLTDTDYDGWSTEADGQSTFLLAKTEYRQRARVGDWDQPDLEYTVVQVKRPSLYEFTEQAMLRHAERFNDPDIPEFLDLYEPVDPTPWNALGAYRLTTGGKPRNQYLLCYEDRLVEIEFAHDWSVTAEQMAITAERLKNA